MGESDDSGNSDGSRNEPSAARHPPRTSDPYEELRNTFLIGSLRAPCYLTDEMGLVTYFNEAASDLWGRRPELHAEKWSGSYRVYNLEGALVTPEERPIARTITLRKLVEPKVAVVQRPDQSLALVCSNPTPLFDRSGNFIGALNFLADVSKTSSNEERLREIQRLAEIGRGILAVSNEINNILSVFANLASVIKRGDPVFASQAAGIAEEMVPRAARLISDLRAFATKRYFVQP